MVICDLRLAREADQTAMRVKQFYPRGNMARQIVWESKFALGLMAVATLTACAAHSGVVPLGDGMYMVSRQAATGFSGSGTLKAEALTEANQFCMAQKKTLSVMNTTEARPPYILGNFPKAEVHFTCVAG